MTCTHQNPVGYLFCSVCGQPLNHKRCLCGCVCAADALYCGRCGHSLIFLDSDDLTSVNLIEHRYDLDMLAQLAGVTHKTHEKQKAKIDSIIVKTVSHGDSLIMPKNEEER